MSTVPYHNATKLNKLESLAVLEGGYGRDSGSTTDDLKVGDGLPNHRNHDDDDDDDDDDEATREPPIALDLSIRRGRLLLLTVLAVAAITATMVFFNRGVDVGTFNARDKNETQREQLLDDYNSYSANVASAFGKPIESFITIAVQIIVLRFMIASMTKPELSWKVGAVTIALSAGIGYLVNNGFNAVNVQLRTRDIQAVISVSDLSMQTGESASVAFSDTLESMRTTTELAPKNPITNTILRNLVRTREPKAPNRCNWFYSQIFGLDERIPDTSLDFGFAQRDWQTRVLPEALAPTKTLRLVANATDPAANKNVQVADLPMNATLAADLFVYAMLMTHWRMKWALGRSDNAFDNATVRAKRYPGTDGPESVAKMAGFLPTSKQPVSETEQREWLFRELQTRLPKALSPRAAVTSDVVMEFSHVDVSPTIQFDALSFEIEVNPSMLSNATTSGRKKRLGVNDECGPWPALCMIKKARLQGENSPYDIMYDTPVQVFAVGACVNKQGVETITANWNAKSELNSLDCNTAANSSMIIVSIGKRLVADSIQQNATFDSRGNSKQTGSAVVKNLRKIYSVTVGRLAWTTSDLSAEYGASCGATDSSACQAVQLALAPPLNTPAGTAVKEQRLVAGVTSLPVKRLPLVGNVTVWEFQSQPLVELKELMRAPNLEGNEKYMNAAGDPLLLHNIQAVEWDSYVLPVMDKTTFVAEVTKDTCRVQVEDRLYLAIKNHMYMEHSLQPAYTAATFFLFQNAVVKDTIALGANRLTLSFDKNVETVALFVSIPDRNAWLTFAGCIVLVACLGYVLLLSTCKNRASSTGASLGEVKEPHVIARVMLDEAQFPPAVLHRRVVRHDSAKDPRQLNQFMINGISLQAQNEQAVRGAGPGK